MSHTSISQTIQHTYGNLIEKNKHPIFALFIDVPPQTIDINVHPRKETVAFINEDSVLETTQHSIKKTIYENLEYKVDPNQPLQLQDNQFRLDHLSKVLKKEVTPWSVKDLKQTTEIIQIHDLYLITQTTHGLVLIDQHAAHERILYEQFKQAFVKKKNQPFPLKKALSLKLATTDSQILASQLDTLKSLGFDISPFGKNSFKINAVPELLKDHHIKELILNVIDELHLFKTHYKTDTLIERTLSSLACRAAIKAGDPLTLSERSRLLEKLAQTKTNYSCPHGRPVSIDVSLNELAKMFMRIK